MNYRIDSIDIFEKQAARLIKKYPSLKKEIFDLIQTLKVNPNQGTAIGKSCYKIRLSISSKGKGKSGGARIITHIVIKNKIVFLLSIYDKSEQPDISDNDLKNLLKKVVPY